MPVVKEHFVLLIINDFSSIFSWLIVVLRKKEFEQFQKNGYPIKCHTMFLKTQNSFKIMIYVYQTCLINAQLKRNWTLKNVFFDI